MLVVERGEPPQLVRLDAERRGAAAPHHRLVEAVGCLRIADPQPRARFAEKRCGSLLAIGQQLCGLPREIAREVAVVESSPRLDRRGRRATRLLVPHGHEMRALHSFAQREHVLELESAVRPRVVGAELGAHDLHAAVPHDARSLGERGGALFRRARRRAPLCEACLEPRDRRHDRRRQVALRAGVGTLAREPAAEECAELSFEILRGVVDGGAASTHLAGVHMRHELLRREHALGDIRRLDPMVSEHEDVDRLGVLARGEEKHTRLAGRESLVGRRLGTAVREGCVPIAGGRHRPHRLREDRRRLVDAAVANRELCRDPGRVRRRRTRARGPAARDLELPRLVGGPRNEIGERHFAGAHLLDRDDPARVEPRGTRDRGIHAQAGAVARVEAVFRHEPCRDDRAATRLARELLERGVVERMQLVAASPQRHDRRRVLGGGLLEVERHGAAEIAPLVRKPRLPADARDGEAEGVGKALCREFAHLRVVLRGTRGVVRMPGPAEHVRRPGASPASLCGRKREDALPRGTRAGMVLGKEALARLLVEVELDERRSRRRLRGHEIRTVVGQLVDEGVVRGSERHERPHLRRNTGCDERLEPERRSLEHDLVARHEERVGEELPARDRDRDDGGREPRAGDAAARGRGEPGITDLRRHRP